MALLPIRKFPRCARCQTGTLVPLSDYDSGAPVHFKAWVCTNEDCESLVTIRRGQIAVDEPIWEQD